MVAGYELSADPARLDIAAIHAYLTRSYWSPGIPRETVERAARHSLCFGIYEVASGAQVGFTRVVTDHATFAYLCDVYVLEAHRGRGLSKWMMREVMSHPALAGARRAMLATRDAHGLYRQFGFAGTERNTNLMEIVRPDIYGPGFTDPALPDRFARFLAAVYCSA
jgi:GNAT superfamily N-acetyltransferase